MTQLIDSNDRLHLEVGRDMRVREAVIEASQDIPSWFLDNLRAEREHQDRKFAADDIKIASIPAAVVDTWFRQGFSVWDPNVTPADIIARLNSEVLSAFLTTSKTV